jgi:acyl-homoserine-lactone acylase
MKKLYLFLLISTKVFAQINTSEIQIVRDTYGVPHIYAPTDPQVAYGLAWAHSEDDFKTMQYTLLAGQGKLAMLNGKSGAAVDYVGVLLKAQITAREKLNTLSPDFIKLCEGYIAGINKYAATHPKEVLVKGSFPITIYDYLASNILSLCVISGVDRVLKDILSGKIEKPLLEENIKGSNAFAFNSKKTTDGAAYLDVNSHQPLEGPVAWYEAHVHSEQGWNMLGGLFPGGCVIFVGTNEHLGWGHTVNHQDKIDVFKLEMKDPKSDEYMFDGKWLKLESTKVKLKVKMGKIILPVSKKAYSSIYGPTLKTKTGTYSIRLGANQDVRGVEQWYRMNKARNFSEFYKAMEMVAIPGFNTIYADRKDTIFYVSNGKIPFRDPAYDWSGVVPGNTSKTLWTTFHPLKDLPQYLNPPSGYVYNTNNTPFHATGPSDNLRAEDFDKTMGYETDDNNRSMRFAELVKNYEKVSYEDFKTIKYDGQYPEKFHFPININAISNIKAEAYPAVKEEIEMMQKWDKKTNVENVGAGLFSTFVYIIGEKYKGTQKVLNEAECIAAIEDSKAYMLKNFKSIAVPLGDVQKLVRDTKEISLPGMPDVLAAMYTIPHTNGLRKGYAGESYIALIKYSKDKLPEIESIINYGASNHADSPHYADQMELFTHQKTKKMSLDKAEVMKTAVRVYAPE